MSPSSVGERLKVLKFSINRGLPIPGTVILPQVNP